MPQIHTTRFNLNFSTYHPSSKDNRQHSQPHILYPIAPHYQSLHQKKGLLSIPSATMAEPPTKSYRAFRPFGDPKATSFCRDLANLNPLDTYSRYEHIRSFFQYMISTETGPRYDLMRSSKRDKACEAIFNEGLGNILCGFVYFEFRRDEIVWKSFCE